MPGEGDLGTDLLPLAKEEYGGVETKDLKRMRELERENARLKRLVGEQALDISLLKELNAKKW